MVCWHFDHSKGKSVKGVNMLNAFYHTQNMEMSQPLRLPIGFQIILKTIVFCEIKTKKVKRKSDYQKRTTSQHDYSGYS